MTSEDQVLDGWMAAIARDGWRDARPDTAAALAGLTATDLTAVLPDRWSALSAFGRRLDRAALAEAASDPDTSVRDRLFALLMARFDAGDAHKAAVRALGEAAKRDPALAAVMLGTLVVSVARIAAAAGVETSGLLGPLRVEALTALVLHASRTWLDDADPDLAATMKALDTDLERAERWAKWRPGQRSAAAAG
ncbi:hypothetical protein KX816_10620 [Sphingosinicellaceae bacterium]|nr:hypothetical protein KX816_10620 [Sphingosinicellaceae bacterium]